MVNAICDTAGILGGLYLLGAPFGKQGRNAPHWMRMALWLTGTAFTIWGALGFLVAFGQSVLSAKGLIAVRQIKAVIGGAGGGIGVLLFASGEFLRAFSKRQPPPHG